jgi:DNA polymerase/3'-5' exonuclease PolX
MKFYILIILIKKHIEKEKEINANKPSLKYIIIAYNNTLNKIYNAYSDNEAVTDKKIINLELTKNMTEKLINLSKINIEKQEEEFKAIRHVNLLRQHLSTLLGIGNKKIDELLAKGLSNIKQIHSKKYFDMLNLDTQITLMHKPNRDINYDDVNKLEDKLTKFSKSIVLTGSYRRKKPVLRDIDILFKYSKTKSLEKYLEYLKIVFKNIYIYSNGPNKVSLIFHDVKYKADIFIANEANYYSMLLYTTGSKDFNIFMRTHAKKLGFLLNQNGIFKNGKKINKDDDSEKKLFDILGLEYVVPEKRF